MNDDPFLAKLSRLGEAFQEAKIVVLAVDLGLFDRLSGGAATAEALARDLEVTERGIEILADALVATGYLGKRQDVYENSPEVERSLVRGMPGSVAHIMGHRNQMFRSWARLDEVVRRGQERKERDKATLTDPKANRNFILGMAEVGRQRVGAVLDRLPLATARRLVDLGGGPGHYACEAVRRHGELTATVVDLPLTVAVASEYIAGAGLAARVGTQICDFYRAESLDVGGPADAVLVSQVLHAEGPTENEALLRKLHPHVERGGFVAIVENLVEPSRTRPVAAALFAVNMLAGTARGRTYTADEVAAWLRAAGFSPEPALLVAERTWIVLARRR